MTKIDENLLLKLEKLAKLKLDPTERSIIRTDLEKIVSMFDQLQEVNTDSVTPTMHMSPSPSTIRSDEICDELTNHAALSNTPQEIDGSIGVPKFLKPKG